MSEINDFLREFADESKNTALYQGVAEAVNRREEFQNPVDNMDLAGYKQQLIAASMLICLQKKKQAEAPQPQEANVAEVDKVLEALNGVIGAIRSNPEMLRVGSDVTQQPEDVINVAPSLSESVVAAVAELKGSQPQLDLSDSDFTGSDYNYAVATLLRPDTGATLSASGG